MREFFQTKINYLELFLARYCNRWTSRKGLIGCNLEAAVCGGGKSDPKDTEKAQKQTSSSLCNRLQLSTCLDFVENILGSNLCGIHTWPSIV